MEDKKFEEITLKFGKGCVGNEFEAKDGNKYCEIKIPNPDQNDHRPWQTFVVKSNQVHENQFGKGMWCKLPADGQTTIHRQVKTGIDNDGKPKWETQKTKIPNRELKKMVEAYKERTPMKEKIAEKKAEASMYKATENTAARQHGMAI